MLRAGVFDKSGEAYGLNAIVASRLRSACEIGLPIGLAARRELVAPACDEHGWGTDEALRFKF